MPPVSDEFVRQLQGYGMLVAEFTYYLPDRPLILGPAFIHQMYDIAPKFPVLNNYIDFWRSRIEGRLHSVRFDHRPLIGSSEYRPVSGVISIN